MRKQWKTLSDEEIKHLAEEASCDVCVHSSKGLHDEPCSICCKNLEGSTNYFNAVEYNSVEHPQHYNREDAMECLDEMIAVFGKECVQAFCMCNVWKYRYRAADKNGQEDLKKSDWYLKKYLELKGVKFNE